MDCGLWIHSGAPKASTIGTVPGISDALKLSLLTGIHSSELALLVGEILWAFSESGRHWEIPTMQCSISQPFLTS